MCAVSAICYLISITWKSEKKEKAVAWQKCVNKSVICICRHSAFIVPDYEYSRREICFPLKVLELFKYFPLFSPTSPTVELRTIAKNGFMFWLEREKELCTHRNWSAQTLLTYGHIETTFAFWHWNLYAHQNRFIAQAVHVHSVVIVLEIGKIREKISERIVQHEYTGKLLIFWSSSAISHLNYRLHQISQQL